MTSSAAAHSAPAPNAHESFERYTVRAHKALLGAVPDPDERNELVWGAWREAHGIHPGEDIAARSFDPQKYSHSPNHCEFAAHETVGRDGQPKKYGLKELAEIVQQHNKEIRDRGSFPSIAEHHTPEPGDPNGKEPAVLGHAGPFRLGMIGRDDPTWAIFADEHHRRDSADVLDKKPFRSVELWTFKDGRKRFHPIAAVGAEAPRLLLPAKYTTPQAGNFREINAGGVSVEKYTVAAVGAFPGGGNTFLKGSKPPEKYATGDSNPEIVASVLEALQATPEFQWLRRAMEEEASFHEPTAEEMGIDPAAPDIDDQITPPAGQPMGQGSPMGGGDDDFSDLDDSQPPTNPEPDDDEPDAKMTANANDGVTVEKYTELVRSHREQVEKYSALQHSHETLLADHGKLLERVTASERKSTDAARSQTIDALAGKFPGFIDADEEKKATLYSLGANVSDDDFTKHVATIEKYAEKAAASAPIPQGVFPDRYTQQRDANVERYEQRLSEVAIDVHAKAQAAGRSLTWDECKAEAEKRIKSNGHAHAAA